MKKYCFISADSQTKNKFFLLVNFIATIKRSLRRSFDLSDPTSTIATLPIVSGITRRVVRSRCPVLSYHYSALQIISICVVMFVFSACENDPEQIELWTKKADLKEEAKNIESYLSQSGVMKAKLTAPLMYRYQRDTIYTEFPNTLHVDFYDDSVRVESWLTAKYGIYYDNLNKVFLRDSVTVINKEGDTLRTPELWWDQNQQKFYTDKPARLDGKDKHLIGTQGLEASQDLKVIQFKYPVGPFDIKEGNMP